MRNPASYVLGVTALSGILGAMGCRSAVADFYDDLQTGGGGTGNTGGTGGLPDDCVGDPTKDPSIVRDDCGAFVDGTVATNGNGSKASPFRSLAAAAKTSKSRIFVCVGDYQETASVETSNGVEVYGGFVSCPKDGNWLWDAEKRASLTGPANLPALVVSMGQNRIENLQVTAPPATVAGASAIALVADEAAIDLVNVELGAGAGAAGANGMVPDEAAVAGVAANPASVTKACDLTLAGGSAGVTICDDGDSAGGDGGKGGMSPAANGEAGLDGAPLPVPNDDGYGLGGVPKGDGTCSVGENGKDGDPGVSGAGGDAKGTLTSSGVAGGDGVDGKGGARGQGGGGGAGSKAGTFCPSGAMTVAGVGASGGGGGGGGCGGKGGGGGKAGGSSIGVVSTKSTLTFVGVLVRTAAGARGGDGGLGKSGGNSGAGGPGGASSGVGTSKAGCNGGNGGFGGNGGQGGGGRGGHSVGIAFTGAAPVTETGITFEVGSAGDGGAGDTALAGTGDGAKGTAGDTVEF